MLNNRIGAFVLVLITLFVAAGADACGQDDYGRIEVLGEWNGDTSVLHVQSYGDTVLRWLRHTRAANEGLLQVSYDAGLSWRFIMGCRIPTYGIIPGIGCRMVGRQQVDSGSGLHEYWLVRHGRLIHRDTIGWGDKRNLLSLREMFVHPLDPDVIIAIGTLAGRVSTYQTLYTSTNDGYTWREYDLPEASQGLSRKVKARVDYSDPKYLFVAVNGGDGVGNPEIDEWYRLSLKEGELASYSRIGILNNYWRLNSTVLRGYRNSLQSQPALCGVPEASCDTLRWSDIIREKLLSEYQVHVPSLDIDPIVVAFSEESQFETFHPLRRGAYISTVRYAQDTTREAERYMGVVITIDTGRTWMWLIRPKRSESFAYFSLDPITMIVYMAHTRQLSPGTEYNAMLKIVPSVLRVDDAKTSTESHAFPNPASETVTLAELITETTTVRVVDVQGRSYVCPCFPHADGSLVVNIRHVPSGIYYVDVLTHEQRRFVPIVVQQ